jgi:twinkle protein
MLRAIIGASALGARRTGTKNTTAACRLRSPGKRLFTYAIIASTKEERMLIPKHEALLEARGITAENALRLGWSSFDKGDGLDWICMPYLRGEVVVNRKYRTISGEKKFFQDKGGEQCLYNVDALKDIGDFPLIITEGEMDCAIALQCGYLAVSVPGGAPSASVEQGDSKKYNFLREIPEHCTVIICADSDGPGAALLHDVSIRLGRERCKWVKYPKDCKDLNDAFLRYGQAGVDATIKRAQFIKIDGIYRMSELPPVPKLEALPCPVSGMGEHYKLRPGDFTVITGVPSHGKSTFINEVAAGMARDHGWNVAFASFEQNPKVDHQRALRTLYHGRPDYVQNDSEHQEADLWIDRHFTFIVPNIEDDVSLEWCLERCRAAILQHGAKMIVIDPWNEMDHLHPPELSLTQYTGFAIKQFKKLARKYLVHVVVVAHPAKMQRHKDGTYPIPSLYDISDSAHWNNKADIGIVVHKEEKDSTTIRVSKIRYFGVIGKPGDVKVRFDDYTNCYQALVI